IRPQRSASQRLGLAAVLNSVASMNSRPLDAFAIVIAFCCCTSLISRAVTPTAAEMDDARRWASAKFEGTSHSPATQPSLAVLSNHGPVQIDHRGDEPLRIGAKTYRRGLYCHAPSKLIVRLPRPGKSFHAEIGVDA